MKMKRESQNKNYKPLKEELIKMNHLCPIRATKFKKILMEGHGERGTVLLFGWEYILVHFWINLEMCIYSEPLKFPPRNEHAYAQR